MITLVPGHRYSLRNFERDCGQVLQFIHKEPARDGSDRLETVCNGTTNEEVLLALIDRMNFLQVKTPCRENAIAITKLEEVLMWINKRTANRLAQGIEGTDR